MLAVKTTTLKCYYTLPTIYFVFFCCFLSLFLRSGIPKLMDLNWSTAKSICLSESSSGRAAVHHCHELTRACVPAQHVHRLG